MKIKLLIASAFTVASLGLITTVFTEPKPVVAQVVPVETITTAPEAPQEPLFAEVATTTETVIEQAPTTSEQPTEAPIVKYLTQEEARQIFKTKYPELSEYYYNRTGTIIHNQVLTEESLDYYVEKYVRPYSSRQVQVYEPQQ